MKTARAFVASNSTYLTTMVFLLAWLSMPSSRATGQAAGNNAVYGGSPLATVGSSSFVDASVLPDTSTSHDICARMNYALYLLTQSPYGNGTSNGAGVIDARGINTSNSTSASGALICTYSPWSSSSGKTLPFNPNAVILLPAGIIGLKSTAAPWVLPDRTRIIGVGSGANGLSVTTLQAGTGVTGAMIEMGAGSSTVCPATNNVCNGVGVEDLRLDGANVAGVIGIQNQYSQELSYVNRVTFYRVKGIGLQVGGASGSPAGAQDSGPYTNIRFEYPNNATPALTTVCAQIIGAPTRGIHGLTCANFSTTIPKVAVNVDSASNSMEDVSINGFTDGIQVGANGSAQSNVLLNISGAFSTGNLIHLCSGVSGSCGSSSNTVTDISIIGATNSSAGGDIIKDDVTVTSVSDAHVGIYVLGEQVSNAGYSRFTTSPNWPNWSVGSSPLTVGSSCTAGSLYSNTSGTGTGNDTLYVCLGGSGSTAGWQDVK